jgi:hypothetical protein
MAPPSSEGDTVKGPLGDERNALLLSLPSLSKLLYITTKLLLLLPLQLPPYAKKEMKQSEPKLWGQTGAFRALFSLMCVSSVTREPPFIGGPGVLKHPNYTFSVPDKRLYTLFKGITVTSRFVRASSVSLHGRASFDSVPSCLSFAR